MLNAERIAAINLAVIPGTHKAAMANSVKACKLDDDGEILMDHYAMNLQ